jgi:mRNA interferase RelE/StbE
VAGYSIELKRSAAQELDEVEPKAQRQRIVARIGALKADPRPLGAQKLAGSAVGYRIRQGDYRVVCEIYDRERRVVVVKIGHRREVYR